MQPKDICIMLKNATYVQKFALLQNWLPHIIESVKKDLKQEHLRRNPAFIRQYFEVKNLNKIGTESMSRAYGSALQAGDESIGEYSAARWLLRHTDIYNFFEMQLQQIAPNFTELEELAPQTSKQLMELSVAEFGAVSTYLFTILNSVVFDAETLKQLGQLAEQESLAADVEKTAQTQAEIGEAAIRALNLELSRSKDKYEKRIAGLERKYLQDTEALKREVARLQRKLAEI